MGNNITVTQSLHDWQIFDIKLINKNQVWARLHSEAKSNNKIYNHSEGK